MIKDERAKGSKRERGNNQIGNRELLVRRGNQTMKRILFIAVAALTLAVVFGFGFIPATERTASCADCDTSNMKGIADIFTEFVKECRKKDPDANQQPKKCLNQTIYNGILIVMKALGKDNRFGPGERILLVGETQNGNLLAGTNRGFNSVIPLNKDSLTVEVNKTDGRNGAIVKICAVDENGAQKRVGTINFPEDSNETGKKTVTVTGVEGKVIRVDIESFGSAVRKFTYTLKTLQ